MAAPIDHLQISISVNRAAEISGLSRATIYRLIDAGTLKSSTVGTRRLIDFASLRTMCTDGTGRRTARETSAA